MDERDEQPQDEVQLPEETVEDLEPGAEEGEDVTGGGLEIGSLKAGDTSHH